MSLPQAATHRAQHPHRLLSSHQPRRGSRPPASQGQGVGPTLFANSVTAPDRRPRSRAASVALRLLLLVVAVALLWPIGAGGMFGGVVVSGRSMEPTLASGDLALVKRTDHVQLGDVVVYQLPADPSASVVRRVVGQDGPVLKLQGDRQGGADAFAVVQDDVVGTVVGHVPRLGGWLTQLPEPRVWAALLLIGTVWWLLPRRSKVGRR